MKQKLRKILALLVLSVSVLGLTACGSANDSETIEYDSAYLQSVSDFLIGSWNGLSEADLDTYATMDEEDAQSMLDSYGLPFTAEAFTTAFAGYEGSMEELGAYVSTDGYEFETKKDEVILITHLTYEQRKADLEIVFNKKSVAQSVTVNPEYSLGEILAKAGIRSTDLDQSGHLLLQLHSEYSGKIRKEERRESTSRKTGSSTGCSSSSSTGRADCG